MKQGFDPLFLANELERLEKDTSSGPWIHDTIENVGHNWTIAMVGYCDDGKTGETHLVTTDHVRASEAHGDAKADALFIAFCKTNARQIIDAIRLGRISQPVAPSDATQADHAYLRGEKRA